MTRVLTTIEVDPNLTRLIAEKLASMARRESDNVLPDSENRLYTLSVDTRFMYHQRAEDLLSWLNSHGYLCVDVNQILLKAANDS